MDRITLRFKKMVTDELLRYAQHISTTEIRFAEELREVAERIERNDYPYVGRVLNKLKKRRMSLKKELQANGFLVTKELEKTIDDEIYRLEEWEKTFLNN